MPLNAGFSGFYCTVKKRSRLDQAEGNSDDLPFLEISAPTSRVLKSCPSRIEDEDRASIDLGSPSRMTGGVPC
jgi:hypothetical protein